MHCKKYIEILQILIIEKCQKYIYSPTILITFPLQFLLLFNAKISVIHCILRKTKNLKKKISLHIHPNFEGQLGQKKCPSYGTEISFFLLYSSFRMSLERKFFNEPFLRKFYSKISTYLTMQEIGAKSLKKVCERGLQLRNDTYNFSTPYPL